MGGGILGLTTARWLARAGRSVAMLDARPLGEGASGVNGGQVIPGLKHDADWLADHLGRERGRALATFAAEAADRVFETIRDEKLSVPHSRTGWIQAAHHGTALEACRRRARALAASGAAVEMLDDRAVAALTGARSYLGGLIDRRAGAIQPFAYVSELARVAVEAGVALCTECRVERLSRDSPHWTVTTTRGSIQAGKVVVATNADADALVPGLAETVLPLHSFQIATEPLASDIAHEILPGGQAVSDSRRIVTYYRKSADGRFVLGGRGTLEPPRDAFDWRHLEKAMVRLFPRLAGVPVTHRWFGRVAMTLDHLPHLHQPEPGLVAVLGCQGRGVALMTALGRPLADFVVTGDPAALPVPVTPIRPIPFHKLRHLGVAAAMAGYRMLDGLQR